MTDLHSIWTTGGIAAVLVAVGAFWSNARNFMVYLSSFVVLRTTVATDEGAVDILARYIRGTHRKVPSGLALVVARNFPIPGRASYLTVPFQMPHKTALYYGPRGAFLVIGEHEMTLLSLRFLSNPQALVTDALEWEDSRINSLTHDQFYVFKRIGTAGDPSAKFRHDIPHGTANEISPSQGGVPTSRGAWQCPEPQVDSSFRCGRETYMVQTKKDPMAGLFFEPDALALIEESKRWLSMREWYAERNIPWRKGYLLHGPGGTGKSSLAAVIAKSLGIQLNHFYLGTMTDREFITEWEGMHAPCVVLFEDFDTVFRKREAVTSHKALNFDCVLNQISGVSSARGIILVVTTNHLEAIDEALGVPENGRSSRPGRIDRILYMGATSPATRRAIAQYVLRDWPERIADVVDGGAGMTPAQFQLACVERAYEWLAGE